MFRFMIALGMFIGLVGGAAAGTWNGAANVPGRDAQYPIERVACGYNDQFCPYGRRRACRPDGYCFCASCRRSYDEQPPQTFGPSFFGVGPGFGPGPQYRENREQRYFPPNRSQYRTFNGCPNGYTVQDGLCKPYTGR